MNNDIWLASFDLGCKNFSFYIESVSIKDFEEIKNIEKDKRYNPNGTCTLKFSEIIKKVCNNGKIILLENVDLTEGVKKGKYFDLEWCHNMNDILDKYKEYWDKVSYFIINMLYTIFHILYHLILIIIIKFLDNHYTLIQLQAKPN